MQLTTANSNTMTIYLTRGFWKGLIVDVQNVDEYPCSVHRLQVMHHVDDDGNHYCPTGFLWCPECGGTAEEPEPRECTLCGRKPEGGEV